MAADKRVRYGEPGVLSDEVFEICAVTCDADGVPWGDHAHILLRDENTGEEWRLSAKAASDLANALRSAARSL